MNQSTENEISAQLTCTLLALPAEIRNHIYRHVAVWPTPVQLTAMPNQDAIDTLRYYPKLPPLILACRTTNEEVKSIYYEENTFHFVEYALRYERIRKFKQRAGKYLNKIPAIVISRAFGVGMFGGRLQFTATLSSKGKILLEKFSSDVVNAPRENYMLPEVREICCCAIKRLVKIRKRSLMEFLEQYLDLDRMWRGRQASVALCGACGLCKVARPAGRQFAWNDEDVVEDTVTGESRKRDAEVDLYKLGAKKRREA